MRYRRKGSILIFCLLLVLVSATACLSSPPSDGTPSSSSSVVSPAPAHYTSAIVHAYPHDKEAFTEGLAFSDGILYEGTGQSGKSSIRKVDLETGKVVQIRTLPAGYFGEGITIYNERLIGLTWRTHTGFVYSKETFKVLQNFSYTTEGWGITNDGRRLIMSDGTSALYFLDPDTFRITGTVDVHDGTMPVHNINELEYIDGMIYANIWLTNTIAIINPDNGLVTGWIDLSGILPDSASPENGPNGIAYDSLHDRLFVTGKLWPYLYEIKTRRP